jgi:hypothetical protein
MTPIESLRGILKNVNLSVFIEGPSIGAGLL